MRLAQLGEVPSDESPGEATAGVGSRRAHQCGAAMGGRAGNLRRHEAPAQVETVAVRPRGEARLSFTSGTVQVITEDNIVITVITR